MKKDIVYGTKDDKPGYGQFVEVFIIFKHNSYMFIMK